MVFWPTVLVLLECKALVVHIQVQGGHILVLELHRLGLVLDAHKLALDDHKRVQGVHMLELVDDMAQVGDMLELDGEEHKDLSLN